jgi:glycosyltransferase 2 family protein
MRDPEKSLNRKRLTDWVRIGGTILSTALFVYLLYKQNWAITLRQLQQIPLWLWLLSLALVICGMFLNALRWYSLLRVQKVRISFIETTRIIFAGAFASNFLPSTIGGDAYRMVALLRYTPDKVLSVTSVVVDRGMNVLAMLTMLPFVFYTFGPTFNIFHLQGRQPAMAQNLPIIAGIMGFLARVKDRFLRTTGVWLKKPASLFLAFFISWWSIFVVYLGVWLLALALGIPVQLYQVMGVSAATYLITLLPISVNGYGLREFTVTALYMQLGATLEQASTLALVTRFFSLVETLPGALWLSQIVPPSEEAAVSGVKTPTSAGKGE